MIDAVLECLVDGKPHTIHYLKYKSGLGEAKLVRLMDFLSFYDLVGQHVNKATGSVEYTIRKPFKRLLETVRP
jgi:hypothetical protein